MSQPAIPKHLMRQATLIGAKPKQRITSNVDVSLTPQERAAGELFEKNMAATEQVLKEAGDGTNAFLGIGSGAPSVVSKRQMNMTHADVMEQRARGEMPVGIYYNDEDDTWVVPDAYKMAWVAGYLCQHCLCWQEIPFHSMCNTIHGGSCCMPNPYAPELDGKTVKHDLTA